MKKVIFRGPVLTQSGYGVHSRQVARWLLGQKNLDVKFFALPWGDTPWIIDKNSHDGLIGKIMERTVGPEYVADVSFQLQLPNEWDTKVAKTNIGLTASVETDRSNPEWLQSCNNMDAVVFPSRHAKMSIGSNGEFKKETFIIPESFNDEIAKNDGFLELPSVDTSFNFLVFGQLTGNNPFNDRKNILFTLKWMCEVFKNDPDVGIILKTNSGRNTRIDKQLVTKMIDSVLSEVRKGDYPKVHLIHGDMSDSDVAKLYKSPKIKALVSLTKGEGYGLPILEAAAAGLPVIATNWSGHLEFLQHIKFIGIDYSLSQLHPSRVDNKIFMQGTRWAEPSESDFKRKITKFRSSNSIPKSWADEGMKVMLEKYSFSEIARQYDELLGKFLK